MKNQTKSAEKNPASMSEASPRSPVACTPSTSLSKTEISSHPASQHSRPVSHLIQSTLKISAKTDCISSTLLSQDEGLARGTSDVSLHAKVDMLINEFKEFTLNSTANSVKGGTSTTLFALDFVQLCKHIRFFSGP